MSIVLRVFGDKLFLYCNLMMVLKVNKDRKKKNLHSHWDAFSGIHEFCAKIFHWICENFDLQVVLDEKSGHHHRH